MARDLSEHAAGALSVTGQESGGTSGNSASTAPGGVPSAPEPGREHPQAPAADAREHKRRTIVHGEGESRPGTWSNVSRDQER